MDEPTSPFPWLEAVRQLRLSTFRCLEDGSPAALSTGGLSSIYVGSIRLSTGGRRRVAVKRFRRPPDDEEATSMQQCISDLRRAGVSLPKSVMLRLSTGEWVQVSQLFGSWRKGSKLAQESLFFRRLPPRARAEAVAELACVANAGYRPVLDLFLTLGDPPQAVVPLDLDLIAPEPEAERRAFHLLRCTMQISGEPVERRELLGVARARTIGEVSVALESKISSADDPFRPYWDPPDDPPTR